MNLYRVRITLEGATVGRYIQTHPDVLRFGYAGQQEHGPVVHVDPALYRSDKSRRVQTDEGRIEYEEGIRASSARRAVEAMLAQLDGYSNVRTLLDNEQGNMLVEVERLNR